MYSCTGSPWVITVSKYDFSSLRHSLPLKLICEFFLFTPIASYLLCIYEQVNWCPAVRLLTLFWTVKIARVSTWICHRNRATYGPEDLLYLWGKNTAATCTFLKEIVCPKLFSLMLILLQVLYILDD